MTNLHTSFQSVQHQTGWSRRSWYTSHVNSPHDVANSPIISTNFFTELPVVQSHNHLPLQPSGLQIMPLTIVDLPLIKSDRFLGVNVVYVSVFDLQIQVMY